MSMGIPSCLLQLEKQQSTVGMVAVGLACNSSGYAIVCCIAITTRSLL